ncbi:lipopolysaccharide biosynthesis protein [Candidatus Latescibacterota bacterium]
MTRLPRSLLVMASGTLAVQAISAVSTPLLARLYSPEAYGQWALIMGTAAILSTVGVLRYELAVVLPEAPRDAAGLVWLCGWLAVAAGVACAVGMWLTARWVLGDLAPWAWTVPLFVTLTGVYQALKWWFTRLAQYALVSVGAIVIPAVTAAIQVAGGFAGHATLSTLIGGSLLGCLAGATTMLVVVRHSSRAELSMVASADRMWALAVRYRNYPLFMTPYTVVGTSRDRIALFLLSALATGHDLGCFALADKLVRLPTSLLAGVLRPVFYQTAATGELRTMEPLVIGALSAINKAATPCLVLFMFGASDAIALVAGEDWRHAGAYAAVLAVRTFAAVHQSWLDRAFDVLGLQKLAFQMEFGFSLASVVVLGVGSWALGSVLYGVAVQSAVLSLYGFLWIHVLFRAAHFDASYLRQLALSCLMRAVVWYVGFQALCQVTSRPTSLVLAASMLVPWIVWGLRRDLQCLRGKA